MFLATTGLADPDRPLRWGITALVLALSASMLCAASIAAWSTAWLIRLLQAILLSLLGPQLMALLFGWTPPLIEIEDPLIDLSLELAELEEYEPVDGPGLDLEPEDFLGDGPPEWVRPVEPLRALDIVAADAEVLTLLGAISSGSGSGFSALLSDSASSDLGALDTMILAGPGDDSLASGIGGAGSGAFLGEGMVSSGIGSRGRGSGSGQGRIGGLGALATAPARAPATGDPPPEPPSDPPGAHRSTLEVMQVSSTLSLTHPAAPTKGARCTVLLDPDEPDEAPVVQGCPARLHKAVIERVLAQPRHRNRRVIVEVRPE